MVPILFENDDVLAVDKPEGLAVIPERARKSPCLMEMLAARDPGRKLFVVHRLDKDVSGVLLVAKSAAAHRYLNGLFEARRIRKTYIAIVHGRLAAAQGRIAAPIRQFGSSRMGVDARQGKACLTVWRSIGTVGSCTQVAVQPVTGRRHQIRVHFYSLGHPVVGDPWYGDPALQAGFPRLLLHARSVAFRLPDGMPVRIASPLPATFRETAARLGPVGRPVPGSPPASAKRPAPARRPVPAGRPAPGGKAHNPGGRRRR
jgi:RluA family pseudouridine synthase